MEMVAVSVLCCCLKSNDCNRNDVDVARCGFLLCEQGQHLSCVSCGGKSVSIPIDLALGQYVMFIDLIVS